jgi:hypothetical protein
VAAPGAARWVRGAGVWAVHGVITTVR